MRLSALCLVLLVGAARTSALPPLPLPLNPPLLCLTEAEGLSSSQVRSVLQGAGEGMWIATSQGLDGYRGGGFTAHFTPANTVLLPDAHLTSMVQDAQGRLWFGTYGGLVLYADDSFITFTRTSGLADNRVLRALADPQGRLWLGTWKGLERYADQGFEPLDRGAGLPAAPVSALVLDRSDCLWVGYARDGVWRSDDSGFRHFTQVRGPAALAVHTLRPDRRGSLWVGSAGQGLWHVDPQGQQMAPAGLAAASVYCLREDHEGRMWAGTSRGLYRLAGEAWQAVPLGGADSLAVVALCEDQEHSLWIGTWGQGLWRLQDGVCSQVEELAGRRIHALLQDHRQDLWATTDQGLYRRQDRTWTRCAIPQDLLAAELGDLLEDSRGNLWISSLERGLLRFDGRRFAHFSPLHHLPQADIHAQARTPDNTLWLGTSAGLVAYDGEQLIVYGPAAGLPHPAVYALAAGQDTSLWIGTGAGLARWRDGRIATVLPAADLPNPAIRSLAADPDGSLWIGTSAGLVHLQGDQRQVFTRADGLPHDHIRALALDSRHRLWIATSAGLAVYDRHHFKTFTTADGLTSDLLFTLLVDRDGGVWAGSLSGGAVRYDGQRFYRLTAQEGLPSNVVRHISQDAEGHIWLATDKGLVRYHRDAIPPAPHSSRWIWGLASLLVLAAAGLWFGARRRRARADAGLLLLAGLVLLAPSSRLWAAAPRIAHVQAARRPNTLWVDITYDLQGPPGQDVLVFLEASADSGRTYDVPVLSLVGDIGPVKPGAARTIVWDTGVDFPGLFATPWQVRLSACLSPALSLAEEMVRIPAGPFTMGSTQGDAQERPVHQVYLPAFWMDRYETTNRAFMRFVQATGYQTRAEREGHSVIYVDGGYQTVLDASWRAPTGSGSDLVNRLNHPVVQMTWEEARTYCQWAGKRLPTEAEWEKAARGTDQRTYPWGDDPPNARSAYRANYGTDNCCHESDQDGFLNTAPVGSFPLGVSPYGLYDMAGNVWEWTQDWYDESYYASGPTRAPAGPAIGRERVLRGGSWISYPFMLRTTYRGRHTEDTRHNYGGFRCARND